MRIRAVNTNRKATGSGMIAFFSIGPPEMSRCRKGANFP